MYYSYDIYICIYIICSRFFANAMIMLPCWLRDYDRALWSLSSSMLPKTPHMSLHRTHSLTERCFQNSYFPAKHISLMQNWRLFLNDTLVLFQLEFVDTCCCCFFFPNDIIPYSTFFLASQLSLLLNVDCTINYNSNIYNHRDRKNKSWQRGYPHTVLLPTPATLLFRPP